MKNTCIKIFVLILITTHFLAPKAMSQSAPADTPSDYFNRFNTFTQKNLNEASALLNIRKLASNKKAIESVRFIIHNSYAQVVINRPFTPGMDSTVIRE